MRQVNQNDDIVGAKSGTLKHCPPTKRTLNPLNPSYVLPGHSERNNLDHNDMFGEQQSSMGAKNFKKAQAEGTKALKGINSAASAGTQENVQPNSQEANPVVKEEVQVSQKAPSVAGSAALPPRSHTSHISKRSSIRASQKQQSVVGEKILAASQADRMSQTSKGAAVNQEQDHQRPEKTG